MTVAQELPQVWPSVVHMLADAARRSPDRLALVCGADRLTYRAYAACVAGLALELQALGITSSERVALVMGNSVDTAIATFGVQASGAQVVPLNPAYTASELATIFDSAAVSAVIFDSAAEPGLRDILRGFPGHRAIRIGTDARRLTVWPDRHDLVEQLPLPSSDTLSTLQFTGGTTGRSKGVDLTHRAVSINVSQREALLPTEPDHERILAMTPLFHVYAVSMGLYLSAYCRGTLVILERYRADLALHAIAEHRITLMSGSPTIFIGLMASPEFATADLASLKLCYSGSAPLAEETLRRWQEATGCPICEGYGQSEAGPVLSFNPVNGVSKLGSVGVAVPATEIEIVDVATGQQVLGPGEIGEIRARGPQIMVGYRNLPAETAQALREGWLYTGDIGELDPDGYLFIRDRKKEMVIVGGYNVYPREVEVVLYSHPAVAEVAVVGVADAYRGEALVASVVVTDASVTADALKAYAADHLVRYKVPSTFRIVDALPKTVVGKIDKSRLRADLAGPT